MPRVANLLFSLGLLLKALSPCLGEDSFISELKPLFEQNCVKCHGGEKTKGKVNLKELSSAKDLLAKPALIKELIEAIDFADMPPEGEGELSDEDRQKTVTALKAFMSEAAKAKDAGKPRLSRLNRFQYNNVVRDLFRLNKDVFELPEKMMTRHQNYLLTNERKIPDQVRVACHSLKPLAGFRGVRPFPKDLRAAHGFDNQTNQLTLSPLLLDSFLKLSVSILESPDFNEKTVGIWKEFFTAPEEGGDLEKEIASRMRVGSLLILWVLAFCSCRREAELADQSPVRGFPVLGEATPQSLSAEKKKSVRDRQAMEMELKWLVLRQKLVAARIEVESAREAELKLALDMARYGDMEERLPGERGFIEAGEDEAPKVTAEVEQEVAPESASASDEVADDTSAEQTPAEEEATADAGPDDAAPESEGGDESDEAEESKS